MKCPCWGFPHEGKNSVGASTELGERGYTLTSGDAEPKNIPPSGVRKSARCHNTAEAAAARITIRARTLVRITRATSDPWTFWRRGPWTFWCSILPVMGLLTRPGGASKVPYTP